jgi:hypothetical protein
MHTCEFTRGVPVARKNAAVEMVMGFRTDMLLSSYFDLPPKTKQAGGQVVLEELIPEAMLPVPEPCACS